MAMRDERNGRAVSSTRVLKLLDSEVELEYRFILECLWLGGVMVWTQDLRPKGPPSTYFGWVTGCGRLGI